MRKLLLIALLMASILACGSDPKKSGVYDDNTVDNDSTTLPDNSTNDSDDSGLNLDNNVDQDTQTPPDKDTVVVADEDNEQPDTPLTDQDGTTTDEEPNDNDVATSDEIVTDSDELIPTDNDTIVIVDETPDLDTAIDPLGDEDGDGINNGTEGTGDPDSDGIPNYLDDDSDGDGILDSVETANDFDSDGTGNFLDTDSDADGILDEFEGDFDFDKDGFDNYLDLDSDGDTVPDSTEGRLDTDSDGYGDFVDMDSDADGLADKVEGMCTNIGKDARLFADTDGDGYSDLAEQAVGSDLCNPAEGVKDFVDFYFVLPFEEPEQTDTLVFAPKIHKADVFFSVDTTYSMNDEINNLKSGLSTIMSQTRSRVADAAFGVAKWEDFNGGDFGSGSDMPWTLLQTPTTNTSTAQTGVNKLTLGNGEDVPESGYESLYQLATGNGTSWSKSYECNCDTWGNCDTCTTNYTVPANHTGIGGVAFRRGSVPIALHITDAESHRASDYGIAAAHTKAQAFAGLNAHAIRVITLQTSTVSTANTQLREISSTTGAVVPVCAFKTSASAWRCGTNQCCTGSGGSAVSPSGGNCVLKYDLPTNATGMGTAIVDGIDAVIKYSVLDIYSNPTDDGSSATINTACFLKRIEALRFVSPPVEPEKSCTPVATPASYNGATYNNGFSNFAPGTSSESKEGAHLEFTVHAENDTCFEPTSSDAQVFTAHIEILDRATGALLDTQDVTIIVPGKIPTGGSEG